MLTPDVSGPLLAVRFYVSLARGETDFTRNYPFSVVHYPPLMDGWHETEIRVRYAETDKMGIVHHSNYLIWFESGRSDLCRARGFSYKEMEENDDALMVVAESYVRYKSPAYYEDLLQVRTRVAEIRSRSIRFIYEVVRSSDETLVAEGETLHLVTDSSRRVKQIPESYREKLMSEPSADTLAMPNQAPH